MNYLKIGFPDKVITGNDTTQFNSQLCWYVFYTFPRAEKVVYRELKNMNYDVFLPMKTTTKVWNNRQKKRMDQIIFPNYIFVKTRRSELYSIIKTPKIVSCIHCGGKPSIIPLKEIEGIQIMLDSNHEISVERDFYEGDRVRIVYGPLSGYEGILLKQNGRTRFGIQIKEINHIVLIDINASQLEKA
jgi:transcription antitermination factor NusG